MGTKIAALTVQKQDNLPRSTETTLRTPPTRLENESFTSCSGLMVLPTPILRRNSRIISRDSGAISLQIGSTLGASGLRVGACLVVAMVTTLSAQSAVNHAERPKEGSFN